MSDLKLNKITHKPYILESQNTQCYVYAGEGVGVVTKDGLKPPKGFAAINPTPLYSFKKIFQQHHNFTQNIFCSVSVSNGEEIAKQTTNAKVGIFGGISILGTTGIVKPISASSYIDSIKEELNFAFANGFETLHFTLGNSSYKKAIEENKDGYIIEIGNFIYDGILYAVQKGFKNIILWIGVAKSVKIAQGFKNTHNRFGSIDFKDVSSWLAQNSKDSITIKGLRESLGESCNEFDFIVEEKTKKQLRQWFNREIKIELIR